MLEFLFKGFLQRSVTAEVEGSSPFNVASSHESPGPLDRGFHAKGDR